MDDTDELVRLALTRAFPRRTLVRAVRWTGGLTNRTYRLSFAEGPDAALRLYTQRASVAAKEIDLHRAVLGHIPVPEVLAADAVGDAGMPPYALFSWIEGLTFREIRRAHDGAATAAAAASIGAILARLSAFRPAAAEAARATAEAILDATDAADDAGAIDPVLAMRIRLHVTQRAKRLDELDADRVLVHGDFSSRNVILSPTEGGWNVAGIIDWERAYVGPALIDIGSLLRYETDDRPLMEPHFSRAYREAGGRLPDDWRALARTCDLFDLVRALTNEQLPGDAREEILAHIAATVTD